MKKYVFACVMSFLCLTAAQQAQAGGPPKDAVSNKAQAGSIGPGRVIEVPSSAVAYAPTAAEIAAREQLMAAKSMHLAPALGPHTTGADVVRPLGTPTDVSAQQASPGPLASNTFTIFKNKLINSGGSQSTVNEPSAANSGKTVVETSNWNIAYSLNGGATNPVWANQNPYALSPGYCCDTQVLYDKERDVFVLMLLDYAGEGASTNGLTISIARGQTPTSWCTYKFNGASFAEGATDTLDFAKIAISNSNLYLTWNDYPPFSGFTASGLARLPLDSLAACAGVGYNYLLRNTEFTFALAQQTSTHDQFWWVSNWMLDGTVNGQNLRIFWWPENSGSYFGVTRGINAYTFGGNNVCSWCGRLDPRYESVVITPAEYRAQANGSFGGDEVLEVATTSGPGGGDPQNYVVYNYFHLNSVSYIGSDATFNNSFSFAYPGCAVNERGYVGCAEVQGSGGAPGGIVILQDRDSPTQPWGFNFVVGSINASSNWGDYVVTNPWQPGGGPFQTVLWNLNGGTVQPYYIVWGRGREANDYARWKSK
jgi:hypothetical protein